MSIHKIHSAYHTFIFAFSCFLMIFIACESDDFKEHTHIHEHQKLDFTGVMVSIDSISRIKTDSKRHFKEKILQLSNTTKNIHSETFGFSIDTTTVRLLRSDDFESYTFIVQRESVPNNILENYVLTYYSQNRYTQFLITYPIIQNSDGSSVPDVSNCTITNLNDTNLLVKANDCVSYAQEWQAGECFDINCNAAGTGNGTHGPGDACNAEPGDQPYTYCNPGTWVNTFCVQYLSDTPLQGGNGGGTGSSGGSSNPNPTPSDPVTFPTVPLQAPDVNHQKNCDELALNSSNTDFTAKMGMLHSNIVGTIEKGFGIYNGSHANPPSANPSVGVILEGTAQGGPDIPYHPFQKGLAHNHLSNPIYNHIGTFSTADMFMLNNIVVLNQQQGNYIQDHEMVSYLVCQEGNYALKVADKTKFYNFVLKCVNDKNFELKINKFYKKNNITHGKPKNVQNTGFLKLLQDFDIGIRLYEADENFQNWNELKLDKSGTVIENPC